MPTSHTNLWHEVERRLGMRVPEGVRAFCEQGDYLDDFSPTPEEDLDFLTDLVRRLQANGCFPAPRDKTVLSAAVPDDGRWRLLAEIGRSFDAKLTGMPVTDEYHGFEPMTVRHYEDGSSYPPSHRVQLDFDSRLTLATVLAVIRKEWATRFKPKGWVRTARRQGDRGLALVRFVCLESPDTATWRERMEEWNRRYKQWPFKDVRAFQSAFRRAEEQLVGHPKGLLPLYTTRADYEKRDRRWRESQLARIRAMGQTREQLLEAKESE